MNHTTTSEIRNSLPLKHKTDPNWSAVAVSDISEFLKDHASCERKAHAAALMLVSRHPELPVLQDRMIALALEELVHFQQVVGLMRERNITLGPDAVDPYVKALLEKARNPKEQRLLDRLLIAAVIEARSAERFCLFADALPEGTLKSFYQKFALEEAQHFPFFVQTAECFYSQTEVQTLLDQLLSYDAEIIIKLPLRAAVH